MTTTRARDDLMELVCEDGQILVRPNGPCDSYSSHSHKAQPKCGNKDNHTPKRPRVLHVDSVVGDEYSPCHDEPTKHVLQEDQITTDIYQRWPHTNFDIFFENTRISPFDDHITQPCLVPVNNTSVSRPGNTRDLVAEVPQVSAAWSRQQHLNLLEQQQNSPILNQTQMMASGNLSNSKLHRWDSSTPDKHCGLQNLSSLTPTVFLNSDDQRGEAAIRSAGGPNLSRVALERTKNKMDIVKSMSNPLEELPPDEQSEAVVPQNVITREQCVDAAFVPESKTEVEKVQIKPDSRDHLAANTSVSSRGASNDSTYLLKRTFEDNDGTEFPREEEQEGTEQKIEARGSKSNKRKRTEIHCLTERRRRGKINKKIRALKDLIPNSSKVDKASVLDEAIEYMKTLQLRVQMLSMGNGLFMPPVMFPSGVQHMQAQILAQMSAMSMGMHMGLGCNLAPFSTLPMHMGLHGQRLPIPVLRPPFFPLIAGASTHSFPVPGISELASGLSLSSNGSVQRNTKQQDLS